MRTQIGTHAFQAPEVDDDDLLGCAYTNAVDIWSLGCVLYNVLTRALPFKKTAAKRQPLAEEPLKGVASSDAIDFIRLLLSVDPNHRPTARVAQEDRWLVNVTLSDSLVRRQTGEVKVAESKQTMVNKVESRKLQHNEPPKTQQTLAETSGSSPDQKTEAPIDDVIAQKLTNFKLTEVSESGAIVNVASSKEARKTAILKPQQTAGDVSSISAVKTPELLKPQQKVIDKLNNPEAQTSTMRKLRRAFANKATMSTGRSPKTATPTTGDSVLIDSTQPKTFRVQNIPPDSDSERLKQRFNLEDQPYLQVRSIVPAVDYNGMDKTEYTATITFQSSNPTIPFPRVLDDYIEIDSNFVGFTPLNHPEDPIVAE